jgi:hypothetical protein
VALRARLPFVVVRSFRAGARQEAYYRLNLMLLWSAPWLTSRRLRAHGAILAICLWSIYVWNISTPGLRDRNGNLKGTDFLHLYTLGTLAGEHRGADLYDTNAQATVATERVPQAAGIRYLPLYPPQVSLLFAPPAHLPYAWALAVWWSCSAAIYGACCYGLWRACPNLRQYGGLVALAAIAFPAFFHLIAWGQTSALALACFTVAYLLLRGRYEFWAGLALGFLIFKPQLGLAAAIVFLLLGAWKVVIGAVLSAAAQLGVGILYYGMEPFRRWIEVLGRLPALLPMFEPKPYQTHSLRTFWSLLVPWGDLSFGLYVLSAMVVLGLTVAGWKQRHARPSETANGGVAAHEALALRYSSLLLATVLVSPHLTVYDLVILAPVFLLLADWLLGQQGSPSKRGLGTLLYLVYMLPLLGPTARWTHVQVSVIAMAGSLYVIWRISYGLANKNAMAVGKRRAQADSW